MPASTRTAACVIKWIDSEKLEQEADGAWLKELNGIVVPGGFGYRGVEGMIRAARYAREHDMPYLGLCLGMQIMVIELARLVLGSSEANSTEFNMFTPQPVIDLLPEQRDVPDKGGTMRLGQYPCQVVPGTRAADAYGSSNIVFERHRHRYEFNNDYRELLGVGGPGVQRPLPGRPAGGDRRDRRPPLDGGHPVPPGVQVPAQPAPPAVRGVHKGVQGQPPGGRPAPPAAGEDGLVRGSTAMAAPISRNLGFELVRVTEAAAMAAARWQGRGDKNAVDGAAVEAMRFVLQSVSMDGVVVIGEGEKDNAPMLYIGEEIGTGDNPKVDVAVDPVDGTTLVSKGLSNAISVVALAPRGTHVQRPGHRLHGEDRHRPGVPGVHQPGRHGGGEPPSGGEGQEAGCRGRHGGHPGPAPPREADARGAGGGRPNQDDQPTATWPAP